jgi:alpha-D-ribose 1-methylphosphonate 5-triphosphate synthase subunit PhnI
MAYTSVTGGAEAIAAAERLIQQLPTEPGEALVELRQVRNQFRAAVDQIMSEGGLYAPDLAALAFRQAEGDMAEAAFMLRAYRSTLPRLGYTVAVGGGEMEVVRRISSTFRDVPGGQVLGRTRDYTQRLLDLDLDAYAGGHDDSAHPNGGANGRGSQAARNDETVEEPWDGRLPKVVDTMRAMGLIPPATAIDEQGEPDDITRNSMRFPVSRPTWLQAMARAETGALVCLAYSGLRGYGGGSHGTIAELRVGDLPIRVTHPLTGQPMTIGGARVTECEMTGPQRKAKQPTGEKTSGGGYGVSYGLVFGQNERKAISMSLLDSSLMAGHTGEGNPAPANDQEMVLSTTDGIESFGFVEHLKLPHFVTFGASLNVSEQLDADRLPAVDEVDLKFETVSETTRELAGVADGGAE